jgi:membrane peptidoglycan carboxypeptidase
MILEVRDASGRTIWKAPDPTPTRVVSPQAAFLVTNILEGNTDPAQNPIWSEKLELLNGPNGEHRPAAVKTGTANEARDLATYGFLAPSRTPGAAALVAGVWMGNSDHSNPHSSEPATSLTAAAPLWHAFVRDVTEGAHVEEFAAPDGVIQATIDAWSGGRPGSWTRDTVREWFIDGTQPGASHAIDPKGLLYTRACGGWRVDPLKAELGPNSWLPDVADWLRRARRGVGVEGRLDSRTAYFWGQRSWGGSLLGPCAKPKPKPEPQPDKPPKDGGGGGGGHGGDGGGTQPTPAPSP